MKTYSVKPKEINRKWYLIDASKLPLGRLATTAAGLLIGKGKTSQTPHIDGGDFVVITNSDNLVITGSLRQKSLKDVAAEDSPQIIRHAVRGMLPDNKLRKGRLERLKIYPGNGHPHTGQSPEPFSSTERAGK